VGANFRLELKKSPCLSHAKAQIVSRLTQATVPLCKGGAGVLGFFLTCVRRSS
jgi:hypothetical protein